ncbi:MAG: arylsulfatase [Mariniblastus sp.]|nr:arylsulfatase [Mariniblastus sp.]
MITLRSLLPLVFSLCFFSSVVLQGDDSPKPSRPNIILVMADDMGYSDIGCYGSEIETPVLDQLAAGGVRFSQFYNTSRCCPTRAALLTGLYSHQAGVGLMTSDLGHDGYRGDLNKNCVTIAEALKPSGYRTYMSGKWHVTKHITANGNNKNWPLQRGFDRFYGTIIGAGSFYDPATLCRDNTFITPVNDKEYQPEHYYYSDAISENAVKYVNDHFKTNPQDPFFMYVSYTSAHWPMHARDQEIAKYQGVYNDGFDPIREARYLKSIQCGVMKPEWKMTPPELNWQNHNNKDWDVRNMEVYAAMVDRMDQGIGWIVDAVKEHDAIDNTIIVYLQDNGGCAEGFGRKSNAEKIKQSRHKPMSADELQTKIWPPMQTRDGRAVRTGPGVEAGSEDTFIGYGKGWANVSNTPFRGYKHDGFEGGISSPLIVHWPAGISKTNAINDSPCHLIDLMPTFLQVANASYPTTFSGNKITPMEGVSLTKAFNGNGIKRSKPLGFEHHGNLALRDEHWKIVSVYRNNKARKWHLYHIESDRTELKDLAESNPAKLNEMIANWQSWADHVGVVEWPIKKKRNK